MIKFNKIAIELGNIVVKNSFLEKKFRLKKDSIFSKTGIYKRFISNKDQTAENIAKKCCAKINSRLLKNTTHIISVSNTPSHCFPSIAHFVSSSFKFSIKNIHCIGLNSGCSGYVDALIIAYDIIKSNKSSKILIITSDTYSKFIKEKDWHLRCLFSDGGSATLISYSSNGWRIKEKYTETIKNTQQFLTMGNYADKTKNIKMDGPAIVDFAINSVIPKLKEFTRKKTQAIIAHQAGKIVINLIKYSINNKKKIFFPTNYRDYGNLISTSIPLILKQNFKRINSLKSIVLCGFGVGLTHSYIKFIKK